jgi:hypothetical protein
MTTLKFDVVHLVGYGNVHKLVITMVDLQKNKYLLPRD